MKKGPILLMCIIALVAFAAWAPNVFATGGLYDNNCADCHGTTRTCAGCHAHGVHSAGAKDDINVAATTDNTTYLPGDTIIVSITGSYVNGTKPGWVRANLYDENGNLIAQASNPCPTCAAGVGGDGPGPPEEFPGPIVLMVPAPTVPGMYTWTASWLGNTLDEGGAAFGLTTTDPTVPGSRAFDFFGSPHTEEIVWVNDMEMFTHSFEVIECTLDSHCDDGLFCNGEEACDPTGTCQPQTAPCDPATETCDEETDTCAPVAVCGNGILDPGEECDGTPCCAADCTFEAAGATCGDASDTECDNPDTCDGAGTCDPNYETAGSACGDQGVECLVDDTCNWKQQRGRP